MFVNLLEQETEFILKFSKDFGVPTRLKDFIKTIPKSYKKWHYSTMSWTIHIKYLEEVKNLLYVYSEEEELQGEKEFKLFMYQFEDPL